MVRSAFLKSCFRSIKESIGRYFSILCITFLGAGVLAGLLAVAPDMKATGDRYYDNNHFMDLNLISTVGFSNADIEALRDLKVIKNITPVYSIDTVATIENKNYTIKLESLHNNNEVNQVKLTSGRLPRQNDELVMIEGMKTANHLKLGDKVAIESTDSLRSAHYTLVGTVENPQYSSSAKIVTSKGKGQIDFVCYANESVFDQKYYTNLYVLLEGTESLDSFSEVYLNKVNTSREEIDTIAEKQKWTNYDSLKKEVDDAREELKQAQLDLNNARELIDKSKKELAQNKAEFEVVKEFLSPEESSQMQQELTVAENEINQNENTLQENAKEFADNQEKFSTEEADFLALEKPNWFIFERNSNESYASFKSDADSMSGMAKIFPVLFYVVAVFVSLTTMTRMIDEDRTLIGTFKSLGYSNRRIRWKYLSYAVSASLIGSIAGVIVGVVILPKTIWAAYSNFYYFPALEINFYPVSILISIISLTLVISVITLLVVDKSLKEVAANLLLPKAPSAGKRILIERFPSLWKRLSFSYKVTIRNMFLDKKRMFMTILGILGCTMLLVTGFGLSKSVSKFTETQYQDILNYDLKVGYEDVSDMSQITQFLNNNNYVKHFSEVQAEAIEVKKNDSANQSHFLELIVPKVEGEFLKVITLQSAANGKLHFNAESVIITEKLAEILNVSKGDTINVKSLSGSNYHKVKITDITENYEANYLYLGQNAYKKSFGEDSVWNQFLIQKNAAIDNQELESKLSKFSEVTYVTFNSDVIKNTKKQLESINMIVVVLIVVAGILAFVVLYNITNINIEERKRELATLEVLGFYPKEMYGYIFREIMGLTVIGCLLGLFSGIFVYRQVLHSLETEFYKFNPSLNISSFLYAAIVTIVFSLLVNFLMMGKIRKIDMLEALKSVE